MLYDWNNNISGILGETLTKVEGMEAGSEAVLFTCASGRKFRMWYEQDCCASCDLEDVIGDPEDLIGHPLLMAEDVSCGDEPAPDNGYGPPESFTWTFVKFATIKGYVTLRWYGSSNGYYSESPTFAEITPKDYKLWN